LLVTLHISRAQQFNVVLDTGSSDLWIASTQCQSCPQGTLGFDSTKSSTFQSQSRQVEIEYGSGAVAGTLVDDTVAMGSYTLQNQGFGECSFYPMHFENSSQLVLALVLVNQLTSGVIDGNSSGLIGLAFQTIASSGVTPFWQSLVQNNQWSSPEMSFWITRFLNDANAQQLEPGGSFTMGGTNTSLYTGNIDFNNFPSNTQASYWLQTMTCKLFCPVV
jgi:cathepsin D